MSDPTAIKITIDSTAKKVPIFKTVSSIEINKSELFKYAIFMLEVPANLKESDFDYLQNRIPALEMLMSDFIAFSKDKISNLSKDDRMQKLISEAVGVAVGLKYSTELLKINPNKFKKIGAATEGKYLDYSTISDKKEYEIETKGTVGRYYSSMRNDIIAKKKGKKSVHLRYGTIALMRSETDTSPSACVIVDDPPEDISTNEDDIYRTQLWNYATFLSYILDSKYYNKYVKPLKQKKILKVQVNNLKFFAKYSFQGKTYFGECFDYRLIKELFENVLKNQTVSKKVFEAVTKSIGRTKFFIGLDEDLITAINTKNETFIQEYESKYILENGTNTIKFLDRDGILIIKSKKGDDVQLEKIFPETEVKNRLGLYSNYIYGYAHKCKAPCRSPEIRGKPCEILTYRTHCHFHR